MMKVIHAEYTTSRATRHGARQWALKLDCGHECLHTVARGRTAPETYQCYFCLPPVKAIQAELPGIPARHAPSRGMPRRSNEVIVRDWGSHKKDQDNGR